jgi:hypothetical protein
VIDFIEVVGSIITIVGFVYGIWRWYSRERGPSPDESLGATMRQSKPAMVFHAPFYWEFNDTQPYVHVATKEMARQFTCGTLTPRLQ